PSQSEAPPPSANSTTADGHDRARRPHFRPFGVPWAGRTTRRGDGGAVDFELQLVLLRVSDVDRARAFYTEKAGFSLDADVSRGDDFRFVQCTPAGSACSVAFGVGLTEGDLGNPLEMYLVVADIEAARELGRAACRERGE